MPKTYIKILIPGGKRYKALIDWKRSSRSFKTATKAEEYATRWKARYKKLKMAEIEMKEFEDSHKDEGT